MKNRLNFKTISRIILAIFMIFAGFSHLTFNRIEFQSQVPHWVPLGKDWVVILSGIVEMILGLGLLFLKKSRVQFGWALAIFYVLIFPGNIAQYINGIDGFGALNSDTARLIRLFFQPVLVVWALWSSNAWQVYQSKKMHQNG